MRAVAQAESTCESLVLVSSIGKTHVNCLSLKGRQMLQVADSTSICECKMVAVIVITVIIIIITITIIMINHHHFPSSAKRFPTRILLHINNRRAKIISSEQHSAAAEPPMLELLFI